MSKVISRHSGADGLLPKKLENSALYRIKEHLQFSGWMQYIPNMMLSLIFFALAGIGALFGVKPAFLFWPPLLLGTGLLAVLIFDLVTVRLGIHPTEAIPKPKSELDAFELMLARYSCRSFQSRTLTDAHRTELLEKAHLYSQPDYLLGDNSIRFEYIAAPLTVWPVVGAQEFLVAITSKDYDRMAVVDVGRSLQKVVQHATQMGLGTCWIGPGADHHSIAAYLGDRFRPEEDHIICICAVGYPSWFMPFSIRLARVGSNSRLPLSSLFFADPFFQKPLDIGADPFNSYGQCYEVCRWSPSSFNSQTTRCAAVVKQVDGGQSVERFDFAAMTKSRYYAPVALGIWCANWETGCQALGMHGQFRILTPEERNLPNAPEQPRYEISWLAGQP